MSKVNVRRKHQQRKQKAATQQFGVFAVFLLVVVGVLAFVLFGGAGTSAMDFEAASLDGQTVRLSEYRGQVVMLNFWATWCPPCRAEMPAIQAAYEEHQEEGFVVLAINNQEPPMQIHSFVSSYALSFPILLDPDGRLQQAYAVRSFPTSIFLDAAGNAYATHSGAVSPAQLDSYIAAGLARS